MGLKIVVLGEFAAPIPAQLIKRSDWGSTSSRFREVRLCGDLTAGFTKTIYEVIEVNGRVHQRNTQREAAPNIL